MNEHIFKPNEFTYVISKGISEEASREFFDSLGLESFQGRYTSDMNDNLYVSTYDDRANIFLDREVSQTFVLIKSVPSTGPAISFIGACIRGERESYMLGNFMGEPFRPVVILLTRFTSDELRKIFTVKESKPWFQNGMREVRDKNKPDFTRTASYMSATNGPGDKLPTAYYMTRAEADELIRLLPTPAGFDPVGATVEPLPEALVISPNKFLRIICGPQGCGKTWRAQMIKDVHIGNVFSFVFQMSHWTQYMSHADSASRNLIVIDGIPDDQDGRAFISEISAVGSANVPTKKDRRAKVVLVTQIPADEVERLTNPDSHG